MDMNFFKTLSIPINNEIRTSLSLLKSSAPLFKSSSTLVFVATHSTDESSRWIKFSVARGCPTHLLPER